MIGLVMCGGKGKRMGTSQEKLLLRYKKPVVQHVISALEESGCFKKIICATSRNAPRTAEFVTRLGLLVVETSGQGYVEDLRHVLKSLDDLVFVVSGDLALLDAEVVKSIVNNYQGKTPWTSVLASKKFLNSIGVRPEYLVIYNGQECAFTGISIVNPKCINQDNQTEESYILFDDKRVGMNINTKNDYDLLGAT